MRAILQYHKVTAAFEWGGTRVTPRQFRRHLQTLRAWGARDGISLGLLPTAAPEGHTPIFWITFDDGFACLYEEALLLMEAEGWRGWVFPVVGAVGRENFWDARFGRTFRHLSWEQLRELVEAGWWIGSHTWSHPDLTRLSPERLQGELERSKKTLEDRLGIAITALAYPFGRFNRKVMAAAQRAGYRLGLTSRPGLLTGTLSPMALPRIGVYFSDLSLSWRLDPFWRPISFAFQRTAHAFAGLSSLARHRCPWLAAIAGMDYTFVSETVSKGGKGDEVERFERGF